MTDNGRFFDEISIQKIAAEEAAEGRRSSTKEQEKQYTSTTTTTTVFNAPGRVLPPDQLERIRQAYVANIGELRGGVAQYIQRVLYRGVEVEVVIGAIEDTGWARHPSPQYLKAILDRYVRCGILTVKDMLRDKQDRFFERQDANRDRWDRWYDTPEDY